MRRVLERYEEVGLGLPYPVVLIDAAVEHSDEAGNVLGVSIPNMEGLAAALAVARAFHPVELDGREVRFMRKVIGMPAKEFAEKLNLDPATFSRWENNKQSVGQWADGHLRLAVVAILAQRMPELKPDMEALFRLAPMKRVEGEPWPEIEVRLGPPAPRPAAAPPEDNWRPVLKAA